MKLIAVNPGRLRPRPMKRVLATAATVAVSSLLMTACAGGSDSGSSSSGGGVAVYSLTALPGSLQPENLQAGLGIKPIITTLGSLLFEFDNNSCETAPDPAKLRGVLADSWKVSEDRKSLAVTLKDTKSATGNPLTSEDIKWSLERNRAVSPIVKFLSSGAMHLAADKPITVVDEKNFTLNFSTPSTLDTVMWTVPSFLVYDSVEVKKHVTAEDPWAAKWLETNMATFGPYAQDTYEKGNQMTLKKNPGWTGASGGVDRVIFKQVAGAAEQGNLLNSGSINYASGLSWSQYKDLQKNSNVKVWNCASLSREVMALQHADPKFADVRVRQAISMGLNRQELIDGARAGFGTPATTGFLPGLLPKSDDLKTWTEDKEAARKLLADAGQSNLSFTLGYVGGNELPILIQSQLKEIGVTVNLQSYASGNDFSQAQRGGKYEALVYNNQGVVPELVFEAGLIQPGAPAMTFGYKSDQFVTTINALSAAVPGSDEYNKLAVELNNITINDVPTVALINVPNVFALSSSIKGAEKGFGTITTAPNPAYFDAMK